MNIPLDNWISWLEHGIGTLVSLGGAAILVGGYYARRRQLAHLSSMDRATAKLIDVAEETTRDASGDVSTFYYPVLEFTDWSGTVRRARGSVGLGTPPEYETTEIYYDHAQPDTVEIAADLRSFFNGLMIVGSGFLVIGVLLYIFNI